MPTRRMLACTIVGRVTDANGLPLVDLGIRVFPERMKHRTRAVGDATITDRDGRYSVGLAPDDLKLARGRRATSDLLVRVFDGDTPLAERRVVLDDRRRLVADFTIEREIREDTPAHAFHVGGGVRRDGQALAGAVVRTYDQALRNRVLLAEGTTDPDGRYTLGYDGEKLLDARRGAANLVVEVIGGDEQVLARSSVRFQAGARELVDLDVDPDAALSEWERLESRLRPVLQDTSVMELTDADVAFIRESARVPPAELQARVQAAAVALRTGLPDWFHYALLRHGMQGAPETVLDVPEARIRAVLAAAQQARTIPRVDDKEMSSVWERLETLRTDRALDRPVPEHRLSVRELLDAAGLESAAQRRLARPLSTRNVDSPSAWEAIRAASGLDGATVERVRLALETATVAQDHLPTIAAVLGDERVRSASDLARHYEAETWHALIEETSSAEGDLPGVAGDSPATRRAGFARQLYARATAAHPTLAVAYGLSRRKELAENPAVRLLPRLADLDDQFDLASVRLDAYLRERAEALEISDERRERVTEEMKRVQRLYRLKPDTTVVSRLLADGLDSAAAVLRKGKHRFVADYEEAAGFGRDTALAVYRQAETNAAKAFAFYTHFSPSFNTLPGGLPVTGDCPGELQAIPHYAALFGSLDGCECEPCESVYSPAAYLTDLLAFLRTGVVRDQSHPNAGRVPTNGLAALEARSFCNADGQVLSRWPRRPDIAQTLLSCRNAETLVPYVDLVLEILENAVAPRGNGVLQTTLPADQLAAQPEHFNAAAYEKLSPAIFPFSLPFDLWHEEEAIYLGKLGTRRAELLETLFEFRVGDPAEFPSGDPHDLTDIRRWQDRDIAKASLGLTDMQWALIAGEPLTPARFVSEAWGYPIGPTWWHPLRNVEALLTRSGLEYKDLLRLLRFKSFNPGGAMVVRDGAGSCDPTAMEVEGLDPEGLDFLHRLLRLQRALGWPLRAVDRALLALSPAGQSGRPALDAAFLVRLSHVIRLQQQFRLPLEELLSWWAPLDTIDRSVPELPHEPPEPPLFERLFLTGRAGEPQFEALRLDAARTELRDPTQPLHNHLPAISSAVGRSQADVTLLIARTIAEDAPRLTLANLSMLYRHASLGRALGLTLEDYLTVRALIGFDPFAPAPLSGSETLDGTLQMLRFVERVEAVRASGFSIAELGYVLRQTVPFPPGTVAPAESWLEQALSALEHGLALPDPFAGIRTKLSQIAALLGPGPSMTAAPAELRSVLLEAMAATVALGDGTGTAALTTELTEAEGLLGASPVSYQPVADKFAAARVVLEGLTQTFVEATLRTQLAADLAGVLDLTVPICAELLRRIPVPADASITAGEALLDALKPAELAAGAQAAPLTRETLRELLVRLHKAGRIVATFRMTERDLRMVLDRSPLLGWLDLAKLPVRGADPAATPPQPADAVASFDEWARLAGLFRFRDALPADQHEYWLDLFAIAAQFQLGAPSHAGAQRRTYIGRLTALSGWDAADLEALVGRWDPAEISHGGGGLLKPGFPAHFADERLPLRALSAVRLLRRLGTTADEAAGWAGGAAGQPPAARVGRIKSALRTRYGDSWPEVVKPLRDPLRERQRQALVTYLRHTWAVARADDLFDHFLIDVEMSPCMMTSRLIQATASVQLLVQRVLLNLEPGLVLTDEAAEQWDWMKNYRVWEANRKIFLYPENWIEPDLRDDKTPIFREFERELLQGEITSETAETAVRHYLEKLHEIGRLQVCGQYLEMGNPAVLHVFARTRDVPHHYYYRRGILEVDAEVMPSGASPAGALDATWTPWERVDVDIEGDHLIPMVYNRRLYLFWPVFSSEDEAPLAHTFQTLLNLFAQLIKLQIHLAGLIRAVFQRLGISVVGGMTNSIISILWGIQKAINVGDVLLVNLYDQRKAVRDIRRALLQALGLPASASSDNTASMINNAQVPDIDALQTVYDNIGALLSSFEQHLLSFLPAKQLEVQLAWSELRYSGWSAKKTSAAAVTFRDVVSTLFENLPELPGLGGAAVRRLFTFRASVDAHNQLTVRCAVALPTSLLDPSTYTSGEWLSEPKEIGHFRLGVCAGELEAVDTGEQIGFVDLFSQATSQVLVLADTTLQALQGDRQLQQRGVPVTPDDDPVRPSAFRAALDAFPVPQHFLPPFSSGAVDHYRVLARHQATSLQQKAVGFFYQDAARSFFCFPSPLPANNPGGPGKPDQGLVFFPFYHPYTCALVEQVQRGGIHALYEDRYVLGAGGRPEPSTGQSAGPLQVVLQNESFFRPPEYAPVGLVYNPPDGPPALRPIEEIGFSTIGAYAQYNWEIFFHIPLLVATRLSTRQKFREAQRWFHYIFNPTDASRGEMPAKYWRTRPFVERAAGDYAVEEIDQLLQLLNAEAEQPGLQELEWAVRRWRRDAFNPHLVARTRTTAFQKSVVMKYVDNLIAWGDSLFRRETREAINEAMQLYILAAKLLGPRPRRNPQTAGRPERTFSELEPHLDAFSNALVPFENYVPAGGPALGPGDARVLAADAGRLDPAVLTRVDRGWRDLVTSPSLQNVTMKPDGAVGLYFCVPPNETLLAKWDLVADRLFKIRHCQNIEGLALQLPLLAPPIDPALLVRAKASGIDIDAVLGQIYTPLPRYRFQVMLQKATELCGEIRSLGGALLSAMEKRDGETLAMLRQTHELRLLEAVQEIKEQQVSESKQALDALKRSQESAALRQAHYQRLLAEFMIPEEIVHIVLGALSLQMQAGQFGAKMVSAAASLIPNIKGGFVTTLGATYGGDNIGFGAERAADGLGHLASLLSALGGLISTMGGYRRRAEDWGLQVGLAAKEHEALARQIAAAEIRVAIAEADLENQKRQIENSREVQEFLQEKFTSGELYDWMLGQIASLYFRTYQMTYDVARQTERAFARELGVDAPGIVKPGYWDSLKKGLLAGEHLHHDLKRLDVAYMAQNAREYELTRHVSLLQIDPLALLELRATGRCRFSLTEELFDMDAPGHYFRRIRTVALSIPCVTGPYAGATCTLSLQGSSIRTSPIVTDGYPRDPAHDDPRFEDAFGSLEAVVTSSGQNDTGLFDPSLRDERYLPFEYAGAISDWQLAMPANPATGDPLPFDYDTISDVVLHVRYTAREGGALLRRRAREHVTALVDGAQAAGSVRLFSLRHDFPSEWARFQRQAPTAGQRFALTIDLRPEHYPFWSRGRLNTVGRVGLLARSAQVQSLDISDKADQNDATAKTDRLDRVEAMGKLLVGQFTNIDLPASPVGTTTLFLDDNRISDLWMAVTWGA